MTALCSKPHFLFKLLSWRCSIVLVFSSSHVNSIFLFYFHLFITFMKPMRPIAVSNWFLDLWFVFLLIQIGDFFDHFHLGMVYSGSWYDCVDVLWWLLVGGWFDDVGHLCCVVSVFEMVDWWLMIDDLGFVICGFFWCMISDRLYLYQCTVCVC